MRRQPTFGLVKRADIVATRFQPKAVGRAIVIKGAACLVVGFAVVVVAPESFFVRCVNGFSSSFAAQAASYRLWGNNFAS